MPASSSFSPESPVVSQGPFGFAAIPEIRRFPIGKAVVLTGPRNKRLVSATEPVELTRLLTGLLTGGFTHYTVVDTTAKQTTRTESRRMASDPRYSFNLIIAMAARVSDPVAYLDDFSPSASIFDSFYSELIEDVSSALADCRPDDMREAQQQISAYATSIRRDQPYHRGVQILQFNVTLEYGKELARRIQALDRMDMHDKYGDKFLAFEGTVDADLKNPNDELMRKLHDIERYDRDSKHEEFSRGLDALKKVHDVTGEEISKLVRSSRIHDSLGRLIEPAHQRERPASAPLISPSPNRREVALLPPAERARSDQAATEISPELLLEARRILAQDSEIWTLADAASIEAIGRRLGHRASAGTDDPSVDSVLWNQFKEEFFQLLCTRDRRYENLRKHLRLADQATRNAAIPAIAGAIAASLGVAVGVLTPLVALALLAAAQLGANAWCATRQGRSRPSFVTPDGHSPLLDKQRVKPNGDSPSQAV
jgi:hypothetical protein